MLTGLDLQIPTRQFIRLLRRSGGGKTTLPQLVGGRETPEAGGIMLDGTPRHGLQRA